MYFAMGAVEALFILLVRQDRISPSILSRASGAVTSSRGKSSSNLRKRLRLATASCTDLPFSVLSSVRGNSSDEELWLTWRWALRDPGAPAWVTGLCTRPELNGSMAKMVAFDCDRACVRVSMPSGEMLVVAGKNLAWNPPDPPGIDAVAKVLEKVLDPQTAAQVCSLLECARCQSYCEIDGKCVAPHSASRRMELGVSRGQDGVTQYFICLACGEMMWAVGRTVVGARKCWEGNHTSVALEKAENRVAFRHASFTYVGDHLEQFIGEIPDSVTSISLDGIIGPFGPILLDSDSEEDDGFGEYIEDISRKQRVRIYRSFPSLKILQLSALPVAEVIVNDGNAPLLRILVLTYMPSCCYYSIQSFSLRILRIQIMPGNESDFEDIVLGCPALEELHAQESWFEDMAIVSMTLRYLDLSNSSEDDQNLQLWTPNLELLNVRSSAFESIQCLPNHPLESFLPSHHVRPALRVRNERSNVEAGSLDHPNATYFDGPVDFDEVSSSEHRSNLLKRFGLDGYGTSSGATNYGGFA